MIIKKTMMIQTLNRPKDIYIYLPYDYDHNNKYPVMYMHDAQNLFDDEISYSKHSWGIKRRLNQIGLPQVIVVGISHGNEHRLSEYAPFNPSTYASSILIKNDFLIKQAQGITYLKWIVEELKPYIDTQFQTLKDCANTMLVGSSMGGLISLYGGIHYPDVFGNIGVLSPAFWYCKDAILNDVQETNIFPDKIFMSVGTNEDGLAQTTDYINDANAMNELLIQKQVSHQYHIIEGGRHNEQDWEVLIPRMMEYFLK